MVKNITFIVLLLFLAGCATLYNPATGKKELIFINSATEVAIGESVATELTKKYELSTDVNLQQRLKKIGSRVTAISDRQDIEYKFFVLKDKELNALTLPGGSIYVFKGLMDILNNDELAYVVAHEVGHVAARHIAKKLQVNMAYQLVLGVAFASLGEKAEAASTQNVVKGVNTVYNLIGLSYSRKDEYEADKLAVKYAFKAGFNPEASLSTLEKLKKEEGPNWKILSYFKTHPYVDERISALKKIIPELTAR